MDLTSRIDQIFHQSIQAKESSRLVLSNQLSLASNVMADALRAGNKIMACGNGGSAADAQHFSAELINRFERERKPLAAIALTTDSSTLTSIGNDYAFEQVFAKQLDALGNEGDILLAISTSGNSGNVREAVTKAQHKKIRVVGLIGNNGGEIGSILGSDDINICVPQEKTARIQEVHLLCLHCLCDGIDNIIFGEE